ncbi:hypothetical protein LX95_01280 [Mesonia algae]|uniref:Uncharacterized protein n=1 Tax=Mesonia algae TaxID=213248 RepID=A0A2W7I5U5_9FLAO|nr:hypothetical protein [Mesonia algae]PZW41599.1 hypothetical protein LX95_01280 [Mesonia algae]
MKSLNIKEIKTTKEVITAAKELAESTVKGLKVRQIKLHQSIGFVKEEKNELELTVFYRLKNNEESNFTIYASDPFRSRVDVSLESLFLELKYKLDKFNLTPEKEVNLEIEL